MPEVRIPVTVRLPADLHERLGKLRDRDGTTIQHAAVTALEEYVSGKGYPAKKKRGT